MYRTNYSHKTNKSFARCEQIVRAYKSFASPAHLWKTFNNEANRTAANGTRAGN